MAVAKKPKIVPGSGTDSTSSIEKIVVVPLTSFAVTNKGLPLGYWRLR